MKLSLLTTLITVASAVVSVSASYASTCENCELVGQDSPPFSGDDKSSILKCNCGDGKGGAPETRLNLDRCLMNDKGIIRPRADGQVSHSCNMFSLDGTSFRGHCKV